MIRNSIFIHSLSEDGGHVDYLLLTAMKCNEVFSARIVAVHISGHRV
jgi:hypothetical protein